MPNQKNPDGSLSNTSQNNSSSGKTPFSSNFGFGVSSDFTPPPVVKTDDLGKYPLHPISTKADEAPRVKKEIKPAFLDISPVISPFKKRPKGKRIVATILGLLILTAGTAFGVKVLQDQQRQQDIRKSAAGTWSLCNDDNSNKPCAYCREEWDGIDPSSIPFSCRTSCGAGTLDCPGGPTYNVLHPAFWCARKEGSNCDQNSPDFKSQTEIIFDIPDTSIGKNESVSGPGHFTAPNCGRVQIDVGIEGTNNVAVSGEVWHSDRNCPDSGTPPPSGSPGPTETPTSQVSGCPFISTQAQVRISSKDDKNAWVDEKKIELGASAKLGGFHNGQGYFAGDPKNTFTPNRADVDFFIKGPGIKGTKKLKPPYPISFKPPQLGTYTFEGKTRSQSGEYYSEDACKDSGKIIVKKDLGAARCKNIKAYDTNWEEVSNEDLSSLASGDKVRFTVSGGPQSDEFDKARFKINSGEWQETTDKKPDSDLFFIEYTIPEDVDEFKIDAQVHHTNKDKWF